MKIVKYSIVTLALCSLIGGAGCSSMHGITDLTGLTSYKQDEADKKENDYIGALVKQREDYDKWKQKCFEYQNAYTDPKTAEQVRFRKNYSLPDIPTDEYKGIDCTQFKQEKIVY